MRREQKVWNREFHHSLGGNQEEKTVNVFECKGEGKQDNQMKGFFF